MTEQLSGFGKTPSGAMGNQLQHMTLSLPGDVYWTLQPLPNIPLFFTR